jgi:hypothetical protein
LCPVTYSNESYSYKYLSSASFYSETITVSAPSYNGGGQGLEYSNPLNRHYWLAPLGESKRISKIKNGSNTCEVLFTATSDRQDLDDYNFNGIKPKLLNFIEVKYGNGASYCKRFNFAYKYFTDPSETSNTYGKRLQLDSLQERSCDDSQVIPAHKFDYEGITNPDGTTFLPNLLSKRIDHWGFYNGATGNDNLQALIPPTTIVNGSSSMPYGQADRESSETPMKYGVLKKITYPTKGHTEFEFEANTIEGNVYGSLRWSKKTGQ